MTLKELRDKRQKLLADVDALSKRAETEKRRLKTEEMQAADKMLNEAEALKAEIRELEDEENLQARMRSAADELKESRGRKTDPGQPGAGAKGGDGGGGQGGQGGDARARQGEAERRYGEVLGKYFRKGEGRLSAEEFDILSRGAVTIAAAEARGQTVGTNSAGGYSVAPLFQSQVTEAMKLYQSVRQAGAEHIVTDTGAALPFPTNDDTGNSSAGIIAEEGAHGTGAALTLGQTSISTYLYSSGTILASVQLLNDAAFPFEAWIQEKLAMRLGRSLNADWTTGSGSGAPQGVITGIGASTGVVSTAANNAFTMDEVIQLFHAVDPAYRASPNCCFGMSDGIALRCKLLKDSYGRPLLTDYRDGSELMILGKPVKIFTDMQATIAPSKTLIIFGDHRYYKTREVRGSMSIVRIGEKYIESGQVGFLAFGRFGGAYINPGNYPIKGLRTIA